MLKRLLLAAGVAYAAWHHYSGTGIPAIAAAAGSLPVADFSPSLHPSLDPVQDAARDVPAVHIEDYVLTPVASFQVAGRVLGAKHYRSGREADLSPVDLAMGWGPMADPDVLQAIDISQGGRFYRWHVDRFPIPAREIVEHSANMHLIPANPEVAAQITAVERGQRVRFKGYLVRIQASDGWHWRSSMTRKDQGAGACEVVLVDALETL